MKLRTILGCALVAALGAWGCDASKPDLEKARADLASVTSERDGLKTQLEQAKAHETSLASQVADLNAKLAAAAQPQKGGAAKSSEHAQTTPQKMEGKPGNKAAQSSARKKA